MPTEIERLRILHLRHPLRSDLPPSHSDLPEPSARFLGSRCCWICERSPEAIRSPSPSSDEYRSLGWTDLISWLLGWNDEKSLVATYNDTCYCL